MSLFLDKKYVSLISIKLERFQQKNDYLWTFRCPHCGDSKKNKLKTRGYFYRKKSNLSFICHNCHSSMSLGNFIKAIDPRLFQEYQMERYKEESHSNVSKPDFSWATAKPVFDKKIIDLPAISELDENHIARKYVLDRKIPESYYNKLYYAKDFEAFVSESFPNYDKMKLVKNDERLVIPFFDQHGGLLGVQGRTLTSSKMRYVTIKTDDNAEKIYGLERVDFSKPIYVVEGPLDSLFLPNAIATMDSSLSSIISLLGNYDYIFVHDNEPRNAEITKQIAKSIATGKKVVIWPKTLTEKDINDMVMASIDVKAVIDAHTYTDLHAKLQFETWRKL